MWEEWLKYRENFEIAATLANANDPARRSQLLYLSIGEEMQGVIRAARLKPELNNPKCYDMFVLGIENYLKSMVDTSSEHEAFSAMEQEKGESTVMFHTRLVQKVRLCGYSETDEDRFVRTQLLKGMRNRDLAHAARTYGYTVDYVIQAATRNESFNPEPGPSASVELAVVERQAEPVQLKQHSREGNGNVRRYRRKQMKEPNGTVARAKPAADREQRCSKCNYTYHRYGRCAAENRKCDKCGRIGHFSAVCTKSKQEHEEKV